MSPRIPKADQVLCTLFLHITFVFKYRTMIIYFSCVFTFDVHPCIECLRISVDHRLAPLLLWIEHFQSNIPEWAMMFLNVSLIKIFLEMYDTVHFVHSSSTTLILYYRHLWSNHTFISLGTVRNNHTSVRQFQPLHLQQKSLFEMSSFSRYSPPRPFPNCS